MHLHVKPVSSTLSCQKHIISRLTEYVSGAIAGSCYMTTGQLRKALTSDNERSQSLGGLGVNSKGFTSEKLNNSKR